MWSRADVIGLFSNNVVSFSRYVVLRNHLFSLNSVSKPRTLSVRADYVFRSLQVRLIRAVWFSPLDSLPESWLCHGKGAKATFQSECGLSTGRRLPETICAAQRIFILTQSRIARAICTSLRDFWAYA
jgi:hypothetical protein